MINHFAHIKWSTDRPNLYAKGYRYFPKFSIRGANIKFAKPDFRRKPILRDVQCFIKMANQSIRFCKRQWLWFGCMIYHPSCKSGIYSELHLSSKHGTFIDDALEIKYLFHPPIHRCSMRLAMQLWRIPDNSTWDSHSSNVEKSYLWSSVRFFYRRFWSMFIIYRFSVVFRIPIFIRNTYLLIAINQLPLVARKD